MRSQIRVFIKILRCKINKGLINILVHIDCSVKGIDGIAFI